MRDSDLFESSANILKENLSIEALAKILWLSHSHQLEKRDNSLSWEKLEEIAKDPVDDVSKEFFRTVASKFLK